MFYALGIQFVEDVIEQQQRRRFCRHLFQESELCQFQRQHERFVLSLTAFALHRIAAQHHLQVVAMDAVQRIAYRTVLEAVALNNIQQRTSLSVRDILQRYLFPLHRDALIDVLEDGHQLAHKLVTLPIDHLARFRHLLFPKFHEHRVRLLLHLQQRVALLQRLVVIGQRLDITVVVLRNHHIHQTAAFLAASLDENGVGRRHIHQRNQPDML